MRNLETHDVFKAMKIINALGVKEEVQKMALKMQSDKKGVNDKEVGVEVILNVIGHAGDEKAENLIYDFLSGPLEIEAETIKHMDPLELIESIKSLNTVIDVESWKAFFKSVVVLMK